ncbi:MAG: hypothetical protein U9O96_07350 [Candidatus Thermoplasmatota archaeon]|nr:hypothetical protein [Candidatus Thermoplasmatota archaeon]
MEDESINEELRKWIEEHGGLEEMKAEMELEEKKAGEKKEITGECRICGARNAKYRCIRCEKEVCPSCYWIMFGICKECISEEMLKKLERKKDLGINKIK